MAGRPLHASKAWGTQRPSVKALHSNCVILGGDRIDAQTIRILR